MAYDREVAGIRCFEVLELLSGYLDGEVNTETASKIEQHVAGCDWCARFGGAFSRTVLDLREHLRVPEPLTAEARERLQRRLEMDLGKLDEGGVGRG